MKRVIAITTVAALFAGLVTAVAYGAQKDFGGPIQGGGTMSFGGLKSSGKFTKAGEFLVNKIPLHCQTGGNTRASFSTSNFVNVSAQRKFSYTFNLPGDDTAKVAGQFNAAGTKASGTVSASHVDFSTRSNCGTGGSKNWRADTFSQFPIHENRSADRRKAARGAAFRIDGALRGVAIHCRAKVGARGGAREAPLERVSWGLGCTGAAAGRRVCLPARPATWSDRRAVRSRHDPSARGPERGARAGLEAVLAQRREVDHEVDAADHLLAEVVAPVDMGGR